MHNLMFLVTIISVVAAAILGFMAWHLRRQEQLRSAARVAALSSAIDAEIDPLDSAVDPVAVSSMFATTQGASVQGRPLIKLAVGLAMAIVMIVGAAMANGGRDEPESGPVVAQRGSAPLELMSMRHTREGTVLKVSGLVRNPRVGAPVARLTAIVFAFDRDGSFLGSGRAPVDFVTLEPGDESPFVVNVPNVASAARYRVSFRSDSGMVRHVDRRGDDAVRLAATDRR